MLLTAASSTCYIVNMNQITKHLDSDFTIVMTAGEENEGGPVWVDFEVYDIIGHGGPKFDEPCYHAAGYTNSNEIVEVASSAVAQVFCHGHIKWDGCCDVYFDEQDGTMLHGCSRKDMTRIGKLFDALYDAALVLMPDREDLE